MSKPAAVVIGQETLAKNIIVFQNRFLEQVNIDMRQVAGILKNAVKGNISETDHTLRDLANLGHPYGLGARDHKPLHTPNYLVHTQSGQMLAGLASDVEPASVSGGKLLATAKAGINASVEHAKNVFYGTSKMIPRDFLTPARESVKGDCIKVLSRSLKNTVVNFDGEKVKL